MTWLRNGGGVFESGRDALTGASLAALEALLDLDLRDFEDERIGLHDWIWVRFNGEVEDNDDLDAPIKSETLSDGTRIEQWTYRRDRFDEEGALISRYILTTTGRVVMNHTIIGALAAA